MMIFGAVQVFCGCCGRIFAVCRHCYRGHKYCSDSCRNAGYAYLHRIAQAIYSQTDNGREKRRLAQIRRRMVKKIKTGKAAYSKAKTRIKQICECIMMKIQHLYLNFDRSSGSGTCVVCGNTIEIDDSNIEIVDIFPD